MSTPIKSIRFHLWVKTLFLIAFLMGASSIPLSIILFGKILPQSLPLLVLIFPFFNSLKNHLELADSRILIRQVSNSIQVIPVNNIKEVSFAGQMVEIRTSLIGKPVKIKFSWIDSRDLSNVITYFKDLQNLIIQKRAQTN